MNMVYLTKYHRSLEVIEKEVKGDLEDALLWIIARATEKYGKADIDALRIELLETPLTKKFITYRVLRLYWGDMTMLYEAQGAYERFYNKTLAVELKESLKEKDIIRIFWLHSTEESKCLFR